MTGYDILKRALILLGYTNEYGEPSPSDSTLKRSCDLINQIILDLGSNQQLNFITDELNTPVTVTEALVYGVAMLLAFSDGDGERNKLFCQFYNAKRATAKSNLDSIKDTLPKTGE